MTLRSWVCGTNQPCFRVNLESLVRLVCKEFLDRRWMTKPKKIKKIKENEKNISGVKSRKHSKLWVKRMHLTGFLQGDRGQRGEVGPQGVVGKPVSCPFVFPHWSRIHFRVPWKKKKNISLQGGKGERGPPGVPGAQGLSGTKGDKVRTCRGCETHLSLVTIKHTSQQYPDVSNGGSVYSWIRLGFPQWRLQKRGQHK